MPRGRLYASNAERQAAYRARLAERHALADSGGLTGRLVELEAALAAANPRAEAAGRRAARAAREAAAARDRYTALLSTRPALIPGAPGWAKDRLADQLAAAQERVSILEATVANLRSRLAATHTSANIPNAPGLNRAARRQAERDRRRQQH